MKHKSSKYALDCLFKNINSPILLKGIDKNTGNKIKDYTKKNEKTKIIVLD